MFGSFLPSLWLVLANLKVYSGAGSRHCYEIIIVRYRVALFPMQDSLLMFIASGRPPNALKRVKLIPMKRYTTHEAAKAIRVSYLTLLRWLYAKKITEPERMIYGGQSLRLWTKADIERARKYKADSLRSRRSRKRRSGEKAK